MVYQCNNAKRLVYENGRRVSFVDLATGGQSQEMDLGRVEGARTQFSFGGVALSPRAKFVIGAYEQGLLLFSLGKPDFVAGLRYSDTEKGGRHSVQFISETLVILVTDRGRISLIELRDSSGRIQLSEIDSIQLDARVELNSGTRFHPIQVADIEDPQARFVCFLGKQDRQAKTMFTVRVDQLGKKLAGIAQLAIPSENFEVNEVDELVTAISAPFAFVIWHGAKDSKGAKTLARIELEKLTYE